MLVVNWLLLATVAILPQGAYPALNRIIGGKKAAIESFPYQLCLRFYDRPICGAALISHDTAITAAHCIPKPGSYSVRAGSVYRESGGVIVYVKQAILHPNHNRYNDDFDIAILKLYTPLKFSSKIQPIKLPKEGETVPPTTKGFVTGWGSISDFLPVYADELRVVEVPVLTEEVCRRSYMSLAITPRMFCAGYREGGKDSCQGDSGGPFAVNDVLYGIVSWGFNCAKPGYPGVYTNVSVLRSYIRTNAGV